MAENETPQLAQYTTETLIALADKIDDPKIAALRELHEEVNNIRNCIVHINDAVSRIKGKNSDDPLANAVLFSIWLDLVELSRITMEARKS